MLEYLDYNNFSDNYDKRYSGNSLSGIADALKSLVDNLETNRILEVGCGTGRWLSEIETNSVKKFGVDLSIGMLNQCSEKRTSAKLICADANHLPFSRPQFDLIYCVNAIHHFRNKNKFISSSRKILNRNGVLSITGFDPHNKNDEWYIYNYFDGTYSNDLERYPSFDDLKTWMCNAGFKNVRLKPADIVQTSWVGKEVFKDLFLRKDQVSQLALLSDADYAQGIKKIKNAIDRNREIVFHVHLAFSIITGNN